MSAAAASPRADDRVIDWTEEIQRVASSAPSLTPAARAAVLTVLASFEAEDGSLADPARKARTALNAAPDPPEAPHAPPARAETLLDALAARLHTRPPQQSAQTAA